MLAFFQFQFEGYIAVLNVLFAADGLDGYGSGFVCAHTLPVLYERYQDQVDEFLYNMLGLVQSQYSKLDSKGILKGGVRFRKSD